MVSLWMLFPDQSPVSYLYLQPRFFKFTSLAATETDPKSCCDNRPPVAAIGGDRCRQVCAVAEITSCWTLCMPGDCCWTQEISLDLDAFSATKKQADALWWALAKLPNLRSVSINAVDCTEKRNMIFFLRSVSSMTQIL